MPIAKDDIIRQLERAIEEYHSHVNQGNAIQKHAIVVWSIILAAVGSGKLLFPCGTSLIILILPVCMFWLLEILHRSVAIRRQRFICNLEERLANENYVADNPIEIYLESMDARIGLKDKLRDARATINRSEIMHFFYIGLIILSIVSVMLFNSIKGN